MIFWKKKYCFFIIINSCEIYKRDIRSPCTAYYCLFKTYLYNIHILHPYIRIIRAYTYNILYYIHLIYEVEKTLLIVIPYIVVSYILCCTYYKYIYVCMYVVYTNISIYIYIYNVCILYIHTCIQITTSSHDALDGIYLYACTYNMYKQPTHYINSNNSGALCRVRRVAAASQTYKQ
jgi:hypothetical protein